jgi:hypothetical protein
MLNGPGTLAVHSVNYPFFLFEGGNERKGWALDACQCRCGWRYKRVGVNMQAKMTWIGVREDGTHESTNGSIERPPNIFMPMDNYETGQLNFPPQRASSALRHAPSRATQVSLRLVNSPAGSLLSCSSTGHKNEGLHRHHGRKPSCGEEEAQQIGGEGTW